MEAAFVLVRAIHTAALVALFGGLVFAAWVATASDAQPLEPNGMRTAAGWMTLALLSGVGWLALEAVSMSGLPLAQALGYENLGTVLTQTEFGRAWTWRGVLSLVFVAALLADSRPGLKAETTRVVLLLVAAGLLASLAFAGHANAERGVAKVVHLGTDALHLLAAGAWLGALWPLATMLATTEDGASPARISEVGRMVQRFSLLGIASVCTIVVTGAVNAWFTVATPNGLVVTHYGHVLLVKLALFAGMLALAAINRTRLTPILTQAGSACDVNPTALRRLRRNTVAELVLGLVILGAVGVLGISMPAAHAPAMTPSMHMP